MVTRIEEKIEPPKRRIVSKDECEHDLQNQDVLTNMFIVFEEALINFEREVVLTPPEARARGFEASLLNSKMMHSIQKHYPDNWRFGKYKRFILRLNGYSILFKKLSRSDIPMNIQTIHAQGIGNQLQIPLFGDSSNVVEPIVFFGYKKNGFGEIIDPKFVYIDEGKVKWSISRNELTVNRNLIINNETIDSDLLSIRIDQQRNKKSS